MRVILVPLDGADHDQAALAAAFGVAKPLQAHVEGLFVRPNPGGLAGAAEAGITSATVEHITRAAAASWDQRRDRARELFDAALAVANATLVDGPIRNGTVTARWREMTGPGNAILAAQGPLTDLIVLAGMHVNDDPQRQLMFEASLLSAARPILLVPGAGLDRLGGVVAVAWNGRAESTRAVAGALPLLRNAEAVHILTVATQRTEIRQSEGLVDYLAWHAVAAEMHALPAAGEVGAALLAKANDLGADLLVMGGYGHSRVHELIFGGVTRHVLDHLTLPILLAH